MDALTLFGLFAVTMMLVFYALEDCALGSIYGFLQGAWPFGVVEAIWAAVAIWRWCPTRSMSSNRSCRAILLSELIGKLTKMLMR